MTANPPSDLMARARTAYELGRLRIALVHAALIALLIGGLRALFVEGVAPIWALLPFVIWTLVGWRGGELQRAARIGLVAGGVSLLLPLSLLRPCCTPGALGEMPTCTMPELCVLGGLLLGAPLALCVQRWTAARDVRAFVGASLGALSSLSLKCSLLALGEALGLAGGLLLGTVLVFSFESLRTRASA